AAVASPLTGWRDAPASRPPPICLPFPVEFAPRVSALSTRCAADRIDVNALHERQVKHQSALANSPAGNIMTAATHCQFEPVSAREVYRVNDVGVAHAAGNQRGPTIDQTVVYPPYLIVPGVIGTQEHAREAHGQVGDTCRIKRSHESSSRILLKN